MLFLTFFALIWSQTLCKVYFYESFDGDYLSRWVESSKADSGKFSATLPKSAVNETDKKLKTIDDAKFYHIAAPFDSVLDTSKSTVVIQFSAHFEQDIDCGGGYVKVVPEGTDLKKFDGSTEYGIMFGPDICGYEKKMIHAILTYKGNNHLIKEKISLSTDTKPHVYTFIMRTDKTFEVLFDGKNQASGKLEESWELLPPKTILDPMDTKPSDWVDEKEIADVTDTKPEDWDKPESIPDATAKKPEDWSDEDDGEWTAPMTSNPEYKGEWKQKMIPNPAYKGEWVQKTINNPDFAFDETIGHYSLAGIGFDLWQVKSGTLFDDVLVTDDEAEAKEYEKMMLAKFEELNKAVDEKEKKDKEEEDLKKKQKSDENKSTDDKDASSPEHGSEPDVDDDDQDDSDEVRESKKSFAQAEAASSSPSHDEL